MKSKVSFFFATESLSILHPETKNYKFFKRSNFFFSSHIICWFTVLQKKWKILKLKISLLHQQLKSMFFWNFFVTTYVPSDLDNTTFRIWLFFKKKHICTFFKNFDSLRDARVCNWEKFQFRSILRHFLQSLSSRCQSSLDESWIWFRWQFPNRFLKNRCSGQSHGKIYLKIEWNFRAHKYYLSIKISMKFK